MIHNVRNIWLNGNFIYEGVLELTTYSQHKLSVRTLKFLKMRGMCVI
jgi:hypothetical protein